MERPLIESIKTGLEKRQDNFDKFINDFQLGQKARIIYNGKRCTVAIDSRVDGIVGLKILRGKNKFVGLDTISFSLVLPQDAELIKLIS
jgi:hypothetical protein